MQIYLYPKSAVLYCITAENIAIYVAIIQYIVASLIMTGEAEQGGPEGRLPPKFHNHSMGL